MRTGAAQALGHTGHGKVSACLLTCMNTVYMVSVQMIHDEIGRRLHNDELGEIVRLDALKKVCLV